LHEDQRGNKDFSEGFFHLSHLHLYFLENADRISDYFRGEKKTFMLAKKLCFQLRVTFGRILYM
jgi:hypothetical protein